MAATIVLMASANHSTTPQRLLQSKLTRGRYEYAAEATHGIDPDHGCGRGTRMRAKPRELVGAVRERA